jgi:hypothetical protein
MKGSIRAFLGFLIVFGCVGGMDNATDAQIYTVLLPSAIVGLALMYWGVSALRDLRG